MSSPVILLRPKLPGLKHYFLLSQFLNELEHMTGEVCYCLKSQYVVYIVTISNNHDINYTVFYNRYWANSTKRN